MLLNDPKIESQNKKVHLKAYYRANMYPNFHISLSHTSASACTIMEKIYGKNANHTEIDRLLYSFSIFLL